MGRRCWDLDLTKMSHFYLTRRQPCLGFFLFAPQRGEIRNQSAHGFALLLYLFTLNSHASLLVSVLFFCDTYSESRNADNDQDKKYFALIVFIFCETISSSASSWLCRDFAPQSSKSKLVFRLIFLNAFALRRQTGRYLCFAIDGHRRKRVDHKGGETRYWMPELWFTNLFSRVYEPKVFSA